MYVTRKRERERERERERDGLDSQGGREKEREGGRERGRERGREEGEREEEKEGGRERGREREREEGRERGRKGEREEGRQTKKIQKGKFIISQKFKKYTLPYVYTQRKKCVQKYSQGTLQSVSKRRPRTGILASAW